MAAPAQTHTATGTTDEGHKGPFPPFDSSSFPGQLLWFAIAFGLLYYVMSKIALPKVGAILEDRRLRIAADLDEAQRMRKQAEEAEAAYEQELATARDKSRAIAQETRDKLSAESDQRRKALEADLSQKLGAAEATIRTRTEEAMSNVKTVAADAASAIVERLTGRVPDQGAIEAALARQSRS